MAVVALVASVAVVAVRLSGSSQAAPVRESTAQRPAAPGDRDGDGVPDAQDLAPDKPGAPGPGDAPDETFEAPKLPRADDCRRKGITRELGGEGTCFEPSGRRVRVVNRGSALTLRELDASLLSVTTRTRRRERAVDVDVHLRIRNKLDGLVDVRADHFGLLLGRGLWTPDPLVNDPVPDSLLRRGVGLSEGESVSGHLIFRVSRRAAGRLDRDGNLQVLQFSDVSLASAGTTVGVFRTYR